VHLQPAHADLGYHRGDFPNAEIAANQVLSLPMYPELAFPQLERVASMLKHNYQVL
jgi:dTDP-4-amino-4,6-dideoxygalactose transaminase